MANSCDQFEHEQNLCADVRFPPPLILLSKLVRAVRPEDLNKMMLIFTACVFWIVFGSFNGRPVSCCLKIRCRKIPFDKVLNYRIQTTALCPINAVVIQTVSGKRLCCDPFSDWTKRVMWKVDEAKKKAREQDPVPAERASTAGSRRRADPVTAIKLPLNSQWNRVTARQKSKGKAKDNHKWVS
ncbi:C-C motif chemokine 21a-like [Cyprinus carpio]|uniref:C-C motif chemokine 21a-like n=1 Tax=Cyprinus carpio TaxID=7962 RepID=A0A9Q9W1I0_CYPCA|nr:C-C motif chemokine 21a-like [Cyprinus carpio]